MERENAWKSYTDQDKTELTELCEGYKSFLSQCKTERLATKRAIELASEAGYVPLAEAIAEKRALKPGDKVWIDNYGKADHARADRNERYRSRREHLGCAYRFPASRPEAESAL